MKVGRLRNSEAREYGDTYMGTWIIFVDVEVTQHRCIIQSSGGEKEDQNLKSSLTKEVSER